MSADMCVPSTSKQGTQPLSSNLLISLLASVSIKGFPKLDLSSDFQTTRNAFPAPLPPPLAPLPQQRSQQHLNPARLPHLLRSPQPPHPAAPSRPGVAPVQEQHSKPATTGSAPSLTPISTSTSKQNPSTCLGPRFSTPTPQPDNSPLSTDNSSSSSRQLHSCMLM